MKDKLFGILQRVGRSFMLPIAILPIAGLFLGLGSSFTNQTTLTAYGLINLLGPGTVFYGALQVLKAAGTIVFDNLPLIFAIGVAIGMAKKEKEVAALSAAISFFIMHASISALIGLSGGTSHFLSGATANVCGINSLQMGVFGGIITGLGVALLHNRYYKIELPQVLSFFGGTRFVPIVSGFAYVIVGIVMFFIWPFVQSAIFAVGDLVLRSGYAGTFVYGFMERLLIPFGLHHVFYLPFWQTGLGGSMTVLGQTVEGAQNIFFAQLADPDVEQFAVSATRFMSGKFPLMIFGLPGAALAMYKTALPEKRKLVSGLLLSAALTSMLTGITEPIEFTFLFLAPLLYGIHCVLAGLSYMLMHLLQVGVGMTFSGGLIDFLLFGVLQGNAKTNWIWIVVVGLGYLVVYYLLFSYLIRKMDLKTPGRGEAEEARLYTRKDMADKKEKSGKKEGKKLPLSARDMEISEAIVSGLGGKHNISDIDCCATRLRCTVYQSDKVDDALLQSTGAKGVVRKGNGVQIIYGPNVTVIKSRLEDYLENTPPVSEHPGKSPETTAGNTIVINSPITGFADELDTAPDEGFASKMMGPGVVVTPTGPDVVAPEDGEILFVFDTGHAIGFLTDSGIDLLIHIGIDTVSLQGKGFHVMVTQGQKVKKGQTLITLDLDYLQAHAPSLCSPIVCTQLPENATVKLLFKGKIATNDPLFTIEMK